jgi:hypothetical protein
MIRRYRRETYYLPDKTEPTSREARPSDGSGHAYEDSVYGSSLLFTLSTDYLEAEAAETVSHLAASGAIGYLIQSTVALISLSLSLSLGFCAPLDD